MKKIVLAYSGGLDTTVILHWLKNTYDAEVIAFTADIGQDHDPELVKSRANSIGASKIIIEDLKEDFTKDYIFQMLKANTLYEGEYLLGTSIARPLISKRLVEIAEEEGVIEESESDIIKNMVKFKDVKIRNIMTPFSVMKIASESETIQNFYNKNTKLSFSRIPIYSEITDNITGYVLKDNILEQIVKNKGDSFLISIKRKAIFSNYESQIPQVFDKLIKEREHISIVTDENGTVKGIVTLEDIIETLLGREIMDETDTVKDMQALAKSKKTGVEE